MLNEFYKNKRVFVTGHTGFKGAWLSTWLVKMGAKVYGFSDGIPTKPSLFEQMKIASSMSSEFGDIRDFVKLRNSITQTKPQILFHMAAQSLVRPSYDTPLETFATNTMGTVHVLEAARACPSLEAVVIVTSDKCYANNETGQAFVETDAMGGDDPYSASKGAAELVFHSYFKSFFAKEKGPGLVSVRAGNVIGGGDWAVDRIVPDAIRAWSTKNKLQLRSPGSIRPWQHVLEPLHGYLLAAQKAATDRSFNGRSYNFGPGRDNEKPVLDLIQTLSKSCDFSTGWDLSSADNLKKSEAQVLRLNPYRAQLELRWRNYLDFSESIEWTGLWYNQMIHDPNSIRDFTLTQLGNFEQKANQSATL